MLFLFRAMCKKELDKTLHFNSLQYFRNREKCFSPYVTWVKNRVMDGKFNNSNQASDRYLYLTCFCIPSFEKSKFRIHGVEWKTNNRKQVKVSKIIVLNENYKRV